jgi:hypothetical protein
MNYNYRGMAAFAASGLLAYKLRSAMCEEENPNLDKVMENMEIP